MINIETNRLIIRDHLHSDLDSMHKLLSDSLAMYYLPDIRTNSFEESKLNLETAIKEASLIDRQKFFFTIVNKKERNYIGEIGFTITENTPKGKRVHLGYFILQKYWGKGFVTEAAKAIIDFAFENVGVHKITTGCIKENIGSEKVMKKCNMKKEAEFIKHIWHDGKWKDRVEYGLLREDWII